MNNQIKNRVRTGDSLIIPAVTIQIPMPPGASVPVQTVQATQSQVPASGTPRR